MDDTRHAGETHGFHGTGDDAGRATGAAPASDAPANQLMAIGEFSRMARLSVRMLRHYDAHGVLVPASVDPWTGHRRYAAHQLRDALDIRTLRDAGFGVSAIQTLLAARGTPAWTTALRLQHDVLAGELDAARQRLALVTRLLEQSRPVGEAPAGGPDHLQEECMSITIERTTVPAMTVVALRGTVATYSDEPLLWQRMSPMLEAQQVETTGPCGVIEHDDEFVEHDPDLSVFLPVAPGTTVDAPLELLDLPARECLVAHVTGGYHQLAAAHDLITRRIVDEGLTLPRAGTLAGHAFNLYLTTPDQVAPEQLVTRVCQPLG